MRNNHYHSFYFLMILGLTSLFVTTLVYTCNSQAQSKKAPESKQLVIGNTPCGKAMTPVLGLLLASGKLAEEEGPDSEPEWYALIVGGNIALIDAFKAHKGVIPGVYAWQATMAVVGYVFSNMTTAPQGKSAGTFVYAMAKLSKASEVCSAEAAAADSSTEKNRSKQNSVSL